MRLADALRIRPGNSVAFVGAGGKSTALARLALELPPDIPALLTTTTRLAVEQRDIAALHRVLDSKTASADVADELLRVGSMLVTGPLSEDGRKWTAPSPAQLDGLREAAERAAGVLIIEADGARNRSLKAPATHEPVIPSFVGLVVPIVGLDILGQPLDETHVHRPERVRDLLQIEKGVAIRSEHILEILTRPDGALKNVPQSAKLRPILNKADDAEREQMGETLAERALREGRIQSVAVASLRQDRPVRLRVDRVGGIVLAAGGSSRLGSPKQLIPWHGKTLVWHVAEIARAGELDPIVVVVGAQAAQVRGAISDLGVEIVENPDWPQGQSASLRMGLDALRERVEAAVFMLADMPHVDEHLVRALVARHRRTAAPIIAPYAGGRWANPVLFDSVTFAALDGIRGDRGGRAIFDQFEIEAVDWDSAILLDVDTPEDLRSLKRSG